ncbi:MAG: nicotinate-nucleotide--dimethylbenzimidazole phosphoribosyltransferase [Methylococcales symbiont of Hymedesmia sp. n. MRB-2018]|nr:MAG: nicotinate-nucleotide--dimethylbenzimidazole phosphoribosyltransferase [Methylococcales symbiont of Hymedesmia sp. n. MRB-2018]KAF3984402.1 MAG: nicotinate-nucleotide--dimethylbenzimidazole phosphoribosyltransferase [Methylococcales symbiont of Hymedesmia sp. n. MRB-2018]
MDWLNNKIPRADVSYYKQALGRQAQLTKPPGSLGLLEEIAARLASLQKNKQPSVDRIWVSVFAADHGVANESVSVFPQAVTAEMVRNFTHGGAAINILSNYVAANFEIVDVGLLKTIENGKVIIERAGCGTANFTKQAAMSHKQLQLAINTGKHAIERAISQQSQLFIGGEMGIANTTSASAIAVVLTGLTVQQLTGAGTGLNADKIEHKAKVIEKAIDLHKTFLISPLKVLQYLGGFEIAALLGAYLYAAQQGLPVLVDGFIASVAALLAIKISPEANTWFFYAHRSHEQGHQCVLQHLQARPLLDLDLRLGEASGAVLAVPLIQMACKIHNEMATFEQAKITITK